MRDVTCLYSVPLVGSSSPAGQGADPGPGSFATLPILDWRREYDKIRGAIQEARRKISLSRDVCTVDSFRRTLTLGTKVLHYIGHGAADYLPFENGRGGVHAVTSNKITSLLTAGNASSHLKLVFVNSCLSRAAGATFIAAGVPHVICIGGDGEEGSLENAGLEDDCAVAFVMGFYLALFSGKSVKDAFAIGQAGVRAMDEIYSQVDYARQAELFKLMPEKAEHTEVLFGDVEEGGVVEMQVRAWKSQGDESRRRNSLF